MIRMTLTAAAIAWLASGVPAGATLTISKQPTQNMSCSNGVCEPTAKDAVLNVDDLKTLLGSGDLEVTTYGYGKRDAKTLIVKAPLNWIKFQLTLSAGISVHVLRSISISDAASLVISSGRSLILEAPISDQDTGSVQLSRVPVIGPNAQITFSNLSAGLNIGGVAYTLVNSLPALVSAVASNPQGSFALANSYDASGDGTYSTSPIMTNFLGNLEGLGNTISNISVSGNACCAAGLIQSVSSSSNVLSVRLAKVGVTSVQGAAGLAYESFGNIESSRVTGAVAGGSQGDIGGMIADNYGNIQDSYSTAKVSAGASLAGANVGGLVGLNVGSIDQSFATGNVSAGNGSGNIGGLVGQDSDNGFENCYASGSVSGGAGLNVGGLVGENDYADFANDSACYSVGAVSGGTGSTVGGFAGINNNVSMSYIYWDTTTSGTGVGVGLGNAGGVAGLTTQQLQSGLPQGFYQEIWAETAGVNGGLPYLKQNAPPK